MDKLAWVDVVSRNGELNVAFSVIPGLEESGNPIGANNLITSATVTRDLDSWSSMSFTHTGADRVRTYLS